MKYQFTVVDIDTLSRRLCNALPLKGEPPLLTPDS